MVPGDAEKHVSRVDAPPPLTRASNARTLTVDRLLRGHALQVVDARADGANVDQRLDVGRLQDDIAVPIDDVGHLQVEPGATLP